MPPSNRARTSGSGSGLAKLLEVILGSVGEAGIKANPEASATTGVQGPTPSGKPLSAVQPKFTASNIFAKPGAARLSNQYTLESGLASDAVGNRLAVEQGLNPILNARNRDTLTAGRESDAAALPDKLKLAQGQNDITVKGSRTMGNDSLLNQRGVIANDDNLSAFNTGVSPGAIAAASAETTANTTLAQRNAEKYLQEADINKAASSQVLANTLAGNTLAGEEIASKRELLPIETKTQGILLKGQPALQQAHTMATRFKEVPEGTTVIDPYASPVRTIFQAPKRGLSMEDPSVVNALNAGRAKQGLSPINIKPSGTYTAPATTSQPEVITSPDSSATPGFVIIGGKKYRITP